MCLGLSRNEMYYIGLSISEEFQKNFIVFGTCIYAIHTELKCSKLTLRPITRQRTLYIHSMIKCALQYSVCN